MIRAENVSLRYADRQVLTNISFTVERGKPLVIVGESGAGKTSLARTLMGLSDGQVSGRVLFDDNDILGFDEAAWRRFRGLRAALVMQSVADSLNPHLTVLDQVADGMVSHGTASWRKARSRARSLLQAQGLSAEIGNRTPAGLSGGELQRILLAMALANDPDLLILDEPTAALDGQARQTCLATLKAEASHRHIILITHDIQAARHLGSAAAVLYAGHLFESGPVARVLTTPRHPYTRGLLRAVPERLVGKDLQGIPGHFEHNDQGCPFLNRCVQRVALCAESVPPLTAEGSHQVACHRGGLVPALTLQGVGKSRDGRRILHDINLTLLMGETVALFGVSGAGKSTLARILSGLETMDCGQITLDQETGGHLGLIPQHPQTAVAPHFTVAEAVCEPLILKGTDPSRADARCRESLAAVQLPDSDTFLARACHSLSGGELQRVTIARALIQSPSVLIADEATSALDVSVQAKVVRLMMDLQDRYGLALLFITHDQALAHRVADRILVLDSGHLRPFANASMPSLLETCTPPEVIPEQANRHRA